MAKNGKKAPPPPVRLAFAKRLEAHRITAGHDTQKAFCEELGIPAGTYSRWERAETEPDLTNLARICNTLNITPNDLLLPKKTQQRVLEPLGHQPKTRLAS